MDLGISSECDIILELYSKHRHFYIFKEIQYRQYKICTHALHAKIKCAQNWYSTKGSSTCIHMYSKTFSICFIKQCIFYYISYFKIDAAAIQT